MDKYGNIKVPIKYESIIGENVLYMVKLNNLWGAYNKTGECIIPVIYEDIACQITEDMLRVKSKQKWGFVDLRNNILIDFQYDMACNFYEGKAYVKIGTSKFYINYQGKKIDSSNWDLEFCSEDIDLVTNFANQFEEHRLAVKLVKGKFGVSNIKSNKIIIPYEYDEIGTHFNNTILV